MNTLKPQSCSAGTTLICQVKEFHLATSPYPTPSPGPKCLEQRLGYEHTLKKHLDSSFMLYSQPMNLRMINLHLDSVMLYSQPENSRIINFTS